MPRFSHFLLGGLLLTGLAFSSGCSSNSDPTPTVTAGTPADPNRITLTDAQQQEVTVSTITVDARPIATTIPLPARVEPASDRESYVTSLVAGRVERLHVRTGDRVRRGTVVAEIASPDLGDMVAMLRRARDEVDRQQRLDRRGVAVQKNLTAAERDWQAARQHLRSIGLSPDRIERVATGEEDLATLPLVAPAEGIVLERMAVLGAPVTAGDRLFHVVNLSPIYVLADVFERNIERIRPGQPVTLTTPSHPGQTFTASIDRILPKVEADRRAAQARIQLPNPDRRLQPGMFATVRVEVASEAQPSLPSTALLTDASGAYVIVAEGERRYRRVYVDADADTGGIVAVPNLAVGTRVVTEGAFQIVSQMNQQAE